MTEPYVDIIPLGGLGEIGMNMMAVECGDTIVVVDAGMMFPDEGMFGVDMVIPDFSYLASNADRVAGILLTHGHEDHIGALPFLLRQVQAPVYGTRLTLALVQSRMKEHKLNFEPELIEIHPRDRLDLGHFSVEFIRVCHSILDGVGLAIDTPAGTIVHTGDFKIEQSPVSNERFDLGRFAEYGEMGVLALLSDSTNVERPGYTMSEKRIGETFRDIFRSCSGRIIVSCFASSLVRIQQVLDVAEEFGRRVAFDGRSMLENVRIAKELGYIRISDDQELPLGSFSSRPDDQVVLITTGSQGEPMSALTRIAVGDHKRIHLKKGDTVILSSRFIPGNERAITRIINNLYRRGAQVIYETVSDVHVSGHAYQEELKMMINLVQPSYFIPIHGEYRHLIKHAELARSVGVPKENTIFAENGNRIRLTSGGVEIVGEVETGRVLVDGKGVGDVGQVVLRDRGRLAEHGMVIPLVVIDDTTGEILSGPDIISKGFVFEDTNEYLLEDAKCLILEVFDRLIEERDPDRGLPLLEVKELQAEIHTELKRFFYRVMGRRPVIIPEVIAL